MAILPQINISNGSLVQIDTESIYNYNRKVINDAKRVYILDNPVLPSNYDEITFLLVDSEIHSSEMVGLGFDDWQHCCKYRLLHDEVLYEVRYTVYDNNFDPNTFLRVVQQAS